MAQPIDRVSAEQNYCKLALEHARSTERGGKDQPDLPVIKPGSAEWEGWRRYFIEYLGFEPVVMKRIRMGLSPSMTVPSQWPEDFDAGYREPRVVVPLRGSWDAEAEA